MVVYSVGTRYDVDGEGQRFLKNSGNLLLTVLCVSFEAKTC